MPACGEEDVHEQAAVHYVFELQQLRKDIDKIISSRISAVLTVAGAPCETAAGQALCEGVSAQRPSGADKEHQVRCSYTEHDRQRRAHATETSDITMREVMKEVMKETADDAPKGLRPYIQKVVGNPWFDYIFATLVFVSSIFICVDLEFERDDSAREQLETVAEVLNFFFLVELVLRVSAEGVSFFKCDRHAALNYLDVVFVLISLFQFTLQFVSDGSWQSKRGQTSLVALRMSRFIRFVKVVRVIRVMRFFRSLRILVYSIFGTLKSLVWAMMLLAMIIYLFAVLFTQAVLEHIDVPARQASLTQREEALLQKFGSLTNSMLTLFMCITGGMNWDTAANLLEDVDPACVVILLAYVTFTILAVLNVITGFFCHSAIQNAESEHEEVIQSQLKAIDEWRAKLQDIFNEIDEFDFGKITLKQFETYCDNDRVRSYFQTLGLDASDAWRIFKILDADGSNTIEVGEFVNGCLHMRGTATRLDAQEILVVNKRLMDQLASFMGVVETSVQDMKPSMEQMRLDALTSTFRSCARVPTYASGTYSCDEFHLSI